MLKSISLLSGAFLLATSASAQDTTKLHRVETKAAPIHAGTFYAATGVFVPAVPGETSAFSRGTSDVIYNNNQNTAVFYDINDDTTIFDEGRVPSLSSPTSTSPVSVTGTSNSYLITDIQFAYATNSIGMGDARIGMFNQYDTCTAPEANGPPILDLQVTGLPGTIQPGTFTSFTFDVDLTNFQFCMIADGDGKYDDEISDRFGWALSLSADPGSMIGPIIGARPGPFAPTGDGTVFQNPGAVGSGLSTVDQWFDRNLVDGDNCFNEGGYDPVSGNPAFGSFWLVLGADLNANCTSCADRIDDNFENNDTCGTAVPLAAPGAFAGLLAREQGDDPDFYRITIPPRSGVSATASFINMDGDIDLIAQSIACDGTIFAVSAGIGDTESITLFNCGTTPADFVLEVFVFGMGGMGCNTYDLTLEVVGNCDGVDDALEDNDSCMDAGPLPEGFIPGLRASVCDPDFYSVVLGAGEELDFTITFDAALADLDLFLFLDDATCGTTGGVIQSSTGITGMENITLLNNTGQTQSYVLLVSVFSTDSAVGCATYDANFDRNGGTEIGDKFCFAELNSTGAGAHIFALGSTTVSAMDFTLCVEFLPAGVNGIFIASMGTTFVANAGGSQGNLCVGGAPVGRFKLPLTPSAGGTMLSVTTDLTMFPQPNGPVAVMPGDTWNFQFWYRDTNPGPTSNFSDAVSVTFN